MIYTYTCVSVHLCYIITMQLRAWVSRLLPPSFTGPGDPGGQRLPVYGIKGRQTGTGWGQGSKKGSAGNAGGVMEACG